MVYVVLPIQGFGICQGTCMCHSSETARKYYEYSDLSDVVSAHKTIMEMAKRRA